MIILETQNLSFGHDSNTLIDNLALHAKQGESIGILGCNGAGKTTLFDLICRIKKPTNGTIFNASQRTAYLTQIITPPPLLRMHEIGRLISSLNANTPPSQAEILSRLTHWSPSLSKRYTDISQKKKPPLAVMEKFAVFLL